MEKKTTYIKTNTLRALNFPKKTTNTFFIETENHGPLLLKYLKISFCQNCNNTFTLRKCYQKKLKTRSPRHLKILLCP